MRNDITEWNWNVDEEEKRKQSKTEMFSDPPWRRPGWKVGEGEGRQKGGGGDRDSYDSEESTKPNQIYTMSDKQRERKGLLPPSLVF